MLKSKGRKKKPVPSIVPMVNAIVTCDGVTRDPNSGKATLYGIFDRIHTDSLPSKASFSIYARLANGSGKHVAILQLHSPDGKLIGPPCPPMDFEIKPEDCMELQMGLSGLTVAKYGTYTIVVLCDGKKIGSCPFTVRKTAQKK